MSRLFEIIRQRRGWTDEYICEVENGTHADLKDLDKAMHHLYEVRQAGRRVVVLPDFDMDGITSGTLGYVGLAELGFNAKLYVPDAQRGHGASDWDVDQIVTTWPHVHTIVTCDTGITSFSAAYRCRELGIHLIVLDHHKEEEGHPERIVDLATAVVDPARLDETYELVGICGAHVFYQLLQAFADRAMPHKSQAIQMLQLFAGIGTVTDVMPLVKENRQLVRNALSLTRLLYSPWNDGQPPEPTLITVLRNEDHHPDYIKAFEGFARVMAHFSRIGKIKEIDKIREDFYGYYLGPTYNAIRRMEGSMLDAFGSFLLDDRDERIERILKDNELRKLMVTEQMDKIASTPQPFAPHVYVCDARKGVLGLLANKLMEMTGLPTMVLNQYPDGSFGGSARSPMWFPMSSIMAEHGFSPQGHEHAFGCAFEDKNQVRRLTEVLAAAADDVAERIAAEGGSIIDEPDLRLGFSDDCDDTGEDMDELVELVEQIESLRPFGHGFEAPQIEVVVDTSRCTMSRIGSESQHLRIELDHGLKLLWWNQGHRQDDLTSQAWESIEDPRSDRKIPTHKTIRLRGTLELNTFMGNTSANLIVDRLV